MLRKFLCLLLCASLMPLSQSHAVEAVLTLPAPGTMVHLSPTFNPPVLKGIKVHPDNPFKFEFVLDQGSLPPVGRVREGGNEEQLKQDSTRLIKYFLAALTTPEKDLWVNLSPYEKDRIVPDSFGQTEMGRDLLAQDYLLKQITASLVYPEGDIGKIFWKRIYELSGNKNVPVNTFNKVWIVPNKAVVYENAQAGTAYVVESSLKVMTEQDYLATDKNISPPLVGGARGGEQSDKAPLPNPPHKGGGNHEMTSQIVHDIIIPQLTKEVNEGKNFAQLRQVYNSLILATWYKKKIKDSILSQVYADKNKISGVNIDDPQEKQRIYERYLQAFKKGAYNYIKEEQDSISGQLIPRKYFSGGESFAGLDNLMQIVDQQKVSKAMLAFMNRSTLAITFMVSVLINVSGDAYAKDAPVLVTQTAQQLTREQQIMVDWFNKNNDRVSLETFSGKEWVAHLKKEGIIGWVGGYIKNVHGLYYVRLNTDHQNPHLRSLYHEGLHIAHIFSKDPVDLMLTLLKFKETLRQSGDQQALEAFYNVLNILRYRYRSRSQILIDFRDGRITEQVAELRLKSHSPILFEQSKIPKFLRDYYKAKEIESLQADALIRQVLNPNDFEDPISLAQAQEEHKGLLNKAQDFSPKVILDRHKNLRDYLDKKIELGVASPFSVGSEFLAYVVDAWVPDQGKQVQNMVPTNQKWSASEKFNRNLGELVKRLTPASKDVLRQHLKKYNYPDLMLDKAQVVNQTGNKAQLSQDHAMQYSNRKTGDRMGDNAHLSHEEAVRLDLAMRTNSIDRSGRDVRREWIDPERRNGFVRRKGDALYVVGGEDMSKTSYLDRHYKQWEYLQKSVIPQLIDRALQIHPENPGLVVVDIGSSTGEELARTFYEIVTALEVRGQDPQRWRIDIWGIEKNRGVVQEAKQRVATISGFYSRRNDEKDTIIGGQRYSDRIMDKLHQYAEKFHESVKITPGDILNLSSQFLRESDLVLLNHVLRLYEGSEGARQHLISRLSQDCPNAVIAIGDYLQLANSFRVNGLQHTFSPQDFIVNNGSSSYFFGLPKHFMNRRPMSGLRPGNSTRSTPDAAMQQPNRTSLPDSGRDRDMAQLVGDQTPVTDKQIREVEKKRALTEEEIEQLNSKYPAFNWRRASKVPWNECVRDPQKQPKPTTVNELNYWLNQIDARSIFLKEIALLYRFRNDDWKPVTMSGLLMTMNKYALSGKKGDRPYYSPDNNYYYPEDQKDAGGNFRDEFHDGVNTAGKIYPFVQEILSKWEVLEQEAFLSALVKLYAKTMSRLLFVSGNNSLAMNMVNGFFRLKGSKGMSHGFLDKKYAFYSVVNLKQVEDDFKRLQVDGAQLSKGDRAMKGGIDFNADKMNLQLQNSGQTIKFHVDPAMLKQLQDSPGFTPVIINIQPMQDLRLFLGLTKGAQGSAG